MGPLDLIKDDEGGASAARLAASLVGRTALLELLQPMMKSIIARRPDFILGYLTQE